MGPLNRSSLRTSLAFAGTLILATLAGCSSLQELNCISDDECGSGFECTGGTCRPATTDGGITEDTSISDTGASDSEISDTGSTDASTDSGSADSGTTDSGSADTTEPDAEGDAAVDVGPLCGNGELNEGEECDFADANSDTEPDVCRTDCTLPTCGDSVIDSGETCEFGPTIDPIPGCRADNCTYCGDGLVNDGEEGCDDGDANSNTEPNACREECEVPYCGDGVVDPEFGEECDPSAPISPGARECDPASCEFVPQDLGCSLCDPLDGLSCGGDPDFECVVSESGAGDTFRCFALCAADTDCPAGEVCTPAFGVGGDGSTVCVPTAGCPITVSPEICGDTIDNDGDGDEDCEDEDCFFEEPCIGENTAGFCTNREDDDRDGFVDCADPECIESCIDLGELDCSNDFDDDYDGDEDCADADCVMSPECAPTGDCPAFFIGEEIGPDVDVGVARLPTSESRFTNSCLDAMGVGGLNQTTIVWVAPFDGVFFVNTEPMEIPAALSVYEGECVPDFGELDCDVPTASSGFAEVLFEAFDGDRYTFVIELPPEADGTPIGLDIGPLDEGDFEICDDSIDNDGDGDIDCADRDDCIGVPPCPCFRDGAGTPGECFVPGSVCTRSSEGVAARCACRDDLQLCFSECVDVRSDDFNCGECGNVCDFGETCREGVCRGGF